MTPDFGQAIAELTLQDAGGVVNKFAAQAAFVKLHNKGPVPTSRYATHDQKQWYRKGYNAGYRAAERLPVRLSAALTNFENK